MNCIFRSSSQKVLHACMQPVVAGTSTLNNFMQLTLISHVQCQLYYNCQKIKLRKLKLACSVHYITIVKKLNYPYRKSKGNAVLSYTISHAFAARIECPHGLCAFFLCIVPAQNVCAYCLCTLFLRTDSVLLYAHCLGTRSVEIISLVVDMKHLLFTEKLGR